MPEGTLDSCPDPLFVTQKRAIFEIWDRMQRFQTDFAIAQELSFYYTSARWRCAKTVLDLGTGNGYYLSKIAGRFPGKVYHGVDISAELIAVAEKEAGGANVSFSHRSLFKVTERYDFVLMRLLLQHLDDIRAVLDHVAGLTSPGGSVLIIDAHDPLRCFYPDLPIFMEFFAAFAEHERRAGRDRGVCNLIEEAIASSIVWRPAGMLQLLIPSTIPGNMDLFTNTYMLLVDLVEQGGELNYDFFAVREAWRRWSNTPNAYMQVGLNMILIDRV